MHWSAFSLPFVVVFHVSLFMFQPEKYGLVSSTSKPAVVLSSTSMLIAMHGPWHRKANRILSGWSFSPKSLDWQSLSLVVASNIFPLFPSCWNKPRVFSQVSTCWYMNLASLYDLWNVTGTLRRKIYCLGYVVEMLVFQHVSFLWVGNLLGCVMFDNLSQIKGKGAQAASVHLNTVFWLLPSYVKTNLGLSVFCQLCLLGVSIVIFGTPPQMGGSSWTNHL